MESNLDSHTHRTSGLCSSRVFPRRACLLSDTRLLQFMFIIFIDGFLRLGWAVLCWLQGTCVRELSLLERAEKLFEVSRSESEDEKNESLNCIVPQGGQIQEVTLPINSLYWYRETSTHLVWHQKSHWSHCRALWLLATGMEQIAHGCLTGPGWSWTALQHKIR